MKRISAILGVALLLAVFAGRASAHGFRSVVFARQVSPVVFSSGYGYGGVSAFAAPACYAAPAAFVAPIVQPLAYAAPIVAPLVQSVAVGGYGLGFSGIGYGGGFASHAVGLGFRRQVVFGNAFRAQRVRVVVPRRAVIIRGRR